MGKPAPTTDAAHEGADRERIHAHLLELIRSVDGIDTAVVASVDGFVQAQVVRQAGAGERLAAMTSSMLALAGAIGRELALGELQVLMVEASEGKVEAASAGEGKGATVSILLPIRTQPASDEQADD